MEIDDERITMEGRLSLYQKWRRTQELSKHIWRRWMAELVPTWRSRLKWTNGQGSLEVGSVVFLIDKDNDPGTWKRGRIEKVFPGDDHHVRVIELLVRVRRLMRPLCKLFPVEIVD